ncbi:hypothetical protein D3C85_1251390 [compost metagenome]
MGVIATLFKNIWGLFAASVKLVPFIVTFVPANPDNGYISEMEASGVPTVLGSSFAQDDVITMNIIRNVL